MTDNFDTSSKTQSSSIAVYEEHNGFNHSHGPELFNEIVSLMANDVLEISSASARRLYNAFAVGFTKNKNTPQSQPIPSLASIPVSVEMAQPNELIVSRVLIDHNTGICPRSDVKLELIKLDSNQRKQFVNSILRVAKSQFEDFKAKTRKKWADNDYATRALRSFTSWLDGRDGTPFTAIIGMYISVALL